MGLHDDIDYSRTHDVTIEEVRSCRMFAHLTDEQACEVIETIKKFTHIVYNYYQKGREKSLK
jgi:hypothetical protein